MELSYTEENYLKQIYRLSKPRQAVNTNAIAACINTRASSVTDMLHKLAEKRLVEYEKYRGVSLTPGGKKTALHIVRKHRLWEVFLVNKLGFTWDKVHDIAEQLEHIQSEELTDKLDQFLGYPKFDPHGDPIPDKNGNLVVAPHTLLLSKGLPGQLYYVVHVLEDDKIFLRFLTDVGITLHTPVKIKQQFTYNGSMELELPGVQKSLVLDQHTQQHILISKKQLWKH